jgi:hypothetical protein
MFLKLAHFLLQKKIFLDGHYLKQGERLWRNQKLIGIKLMIQDLHLEVKLIQKIELDHYVILDQASEHSLIN